jgi:hypothetical protein
MDDDEVQKMMEWLDLPVTETSAPNIAGTVDLEQMIQDNNDMEMNEYTTAKHVVIDAVKSYEQLALILNIYYHATTGAKILKVVDLDNDPDAIQMHIQSDKHNQ